MTALDALSVGELTPDEARRAVAAIASAARVIELDELIRRVEALSTEAPRTRGP
ncbi:hypothetical protein [Thiohalocapsa marina]|uniref:hypothetical protein n=1 Tax=Thiohalocapsa marina TaxID=424902 RepID=UPI0036DD9333